MSNLDEAKLTLSHDAPDGAEGCSPAVQDYLRAIYALTRDASAAAEFAATGDLAGLLAVRPASVTAMLQKLAAAHPALIDYHKSRGARLTPAGEKAALAVVRRHRLLELYLHQKLGYRWDEVHEEADRLEHVISADLAERLSAALGRPTHDPHGHPIPAADLSLPRTTAQPLAGMRPEQVAVVVSVADRDAAALRELDAVGLRPGARVRLLSIGSDGALRVRVGDAGDYVLGRPAADAVLVARPQPDFDRATARPAAAPESARP